MLHLMIALALLLHGVGHAVGFWIPVPSWFAVAWLLPGLGFLAGSWACWQRVDWWPVLIVASSAASLLLVLATGALRAGPLASALAFDVVVLAVLLVPWSRHVATGA
jgi:hypothetical protein